MWNADYDNLGPAQKRYENVIKSENDDRLYRALILRNEMRVLLISDPSTDKAATALDVSMGYMNDPNDMPGLSHLCQHMLYLTNKTGTPQKLFRDFVSENNGTADATLLPEDSVYYFDIAPCKFEETFMRFVELFLQKPKFPENIIEEEMTIMDNEREMNRKKDKGVNGLYHMMRWSMCKHHPFSKIGIGRVRTSLCEKSIRERLRTYYNMYYVAINMTLCVLSKDSLDDLEDMVTGAFCFLKRVYFHPPSFWKLPQMPSAYKVWCGPDENCRKLYIVFPTVYPDIDTSINARNTTKRFLAHLIEYEGKGTFATTLKAKNWVKSIEAGEFPCTSSLFTVAVDITEEGLEHIDDIVTLFFQYVNLLRKSKLRRPFNEYREIAELKFRFKKKESPLEYVRSLVRSLYIYFPVNYVLRGQYVPQKWTPKLIEIMDYFLSPLKMGIYVISPKYRSIRNEQEPWTGLRYMKEMIPKKTYAAWINACGSTILNVPTHNEFIPTITGIKSQNNVKKYPTVLNKNRLKIWYKYDDMFNEPRVNMIFHFICPFSCESPVRAHYTTMFLRLLDRSLSEYVQPASLVDLHWEFHATIYGIELKISGFNNKQDVLLEKIIERMINFKLNPETFEIDRQNNLEFSMKELEKFKNSSPYEQAQYYLSHLLTSYLWDKEEILKAAADVTFDKLQDFISNLFLLTRVVGLIHGNITQLEVYNIHSLMSNCIAKVSTFKVWQEPWYRDIQLKNGWHFIFEKETTVCNNSCIIIYYQIPDYKHSPEWNVYVDLLFYILTSILHDEEKLLKGKLGYKSYNGVYRSHETQGFTFTIQGRNLSHEAIKKRFDMLMRSSVDEIGKMPNKKLQEYKALFLESHLAKKPKTLNDVTNAYWREILNNRYHFDRYDIEIQCLNSITVPMLYSFFKNIMEASTLSVCVTATSKPREITYDPNQMTTKINNVKSYKQAFKMILSEERS